MKLANHPFTITLCVGLLSVLQVEAQPAAPPAQADAPLAQPSTSLALLPPTSEPKYVLGPRDQIVIRAFEMPEISERAFRVEEDGVVGLPVLGRVRASGQTVEQFEQTLVKLLREYVRRPQVTVTVVQFRTEPLFFTGAFRSPGIYPLQGRRTLVEMLTAAGGLMPNSSRKVRIARKKEFGPIPLPNATESPDGKTTVAIVSIGSLSGGISPAEDIVLQPFDVISAERAETVYVNGEVGRVGGIEVGERDSLTITQVITMAGGLSREADPSKARVLRPVLDTSRRAEIPVDIKKILAGQQSDFVLLPNDLLYVPKSSSFNKNLARGALFALPVASSFIWLAVR